MGIRGQLQVENDARIIAHLQGLDRRTQRVTVRKATTAAGRVALKTTQRNARSIKQTGFTARSLKSVTLSRKGITVVRVGQAKQKTFKARNTNRVAGRNLSQLQRAGRPVPLHWIERGVKPHIIRAAPGRLLAFRVGRSTKKRSGFAFARQVRSPGMRARHLLRKSARQSQRPAGNAFSTVVRSTLHA